MFEDHTPNLREKMASETKLFSFVLEGHDFQLWVSNEINSLKEVFSYSFKIKFHLWRTENEHRREFPQFLAEDFGVSNGFWEANVS